jgi:hypothetical protein
MATNKTKFFRVAVEGATVDGREIKREWLTQMASNYDPEVYGARLNVEHVKGFAPLSANSPFGAYGDVIALEAREIDGGPLKGKLALYARIDPTEDMVALSKKRQKIYTSIEVNPAFADTGEAYLVGLAATDDPASLGTEVLQFVAKRSNNLLSAPCETAIEIDGEVETSSLFSVVKGMFARHRTSDDQRHSDVRRAVEEIAAFATRHALEAAELRVELASARQDAIDAKNRAGEAAAAVEALIEKLSTTDNSASRRPLSTGSAGDLVTDC